MDLNLQNLVTVLNDASGAERGPLQEVAESQLKKWETTQGYHYLLQQVYSDMSHSLQIRWLAIICLKNGVEKYWRASRIHAISREEKAAIKTSLFNLVGESNNQLTIQNAHTIARIARLDFPTEWPSLFEDLANVLESNSNDVIRIHNVLIILNQVLKVLATVRIGRARAAMQSKAPLITPLLVKFYSGFFQSWTSNFDSAIMEVGYVCLKCLRRIIVDGYDFPHRDKLIVEFFQVSLNDFKKLLIQHESSNMELLERYLKCYIKLYSNLVTDNAASFILMPCSTEILMTLLSLLESKAEAIYNSSDDDEFWEQLAIKAILLLKRLTTFAYKKGAILLRQKNDKQEIEQATKSISEGFFTPQMVEQIVNLLINWYLKLKPNDLEKWSIEPEEWVNEELQVSWEYQVRPCAENYYQDLSTFFKPFLSNYIMQRIETGLNNSNSLNDILTKDSILAVFQLSSNAIGDSVDFDQLFQQFFLPEAMKLEPLENKIIRRRVCLVINEWLPIQSSKETRIAMYNLMLHLLRSEDALNDIVVKLTTIQTLQHLVDDWEFRKKDFKPVLDNIVASLLSILGTLQLAESKMFVLQVLSIIIERTNPLISFNVLENIMYMIPIMWESSNSANETIVKNSLLRVLRDLITSLNDKSVSAHQIVLPLLRVCCEPTSEFYSLLCEDGFELWSVILKQLPAQSELPQQLVEVFPLVVKGLTDWTEILALVTEIVRSYALINLNLFANQTGLEIYKVLGGYLSTMRDDSLAIVGSFLDISFIQLSDNSKLNGINSSIIISNYVESGLFNSMINYINRESEAPSNETRIAIPLCRLIYNSPNTFVQLLSHISTSDASVAILLNRVLSSLMNLLRMINEHKVRKIFMLSLLKVYQQLSMNKFYEFMASDSFISLTDDEEYNIIQFQQDQEIAIGYILSLRFPRFLFLLTHLLEEVSETTTGDAPVYHLQTSYDDDNELVLINAEQEEEDEGDGFGGYENEYAMEFKYPPSGNKLRFNSLILSDDPVHKVSLKDMAKGTIRNLNDSLGRGSFDKLVEKVDANTLDQLQMIVR